VLSVIWVLEAASSGKDNIGLNISHHQIYCFSMALIQLPFWVCQLDLAQNSRQIQRSGRVCSEFRKSHRMLKIDEEP